MATYMQGALKSGSNPSEYTGVGYAVFSQTAVVTSVAAGTAAAGTITIPANSQIVNIFADKIVDWVVGGGTATTLPVFAGSTVGGVEYLPSTDMASTARVALTGSNVTVAIAAAIDNVGSSTTVHLTVDPNGTVVTTQAQVRFTVQYVITE